MWGCVTVFEYTAQADLDSLVFYFSRPGTGQEDEEEH
jgi:hypothetical protein